MPRTIAPQSVATTRFPIRLGRFRSIVLLAAVTVGSSAAQSFTVQDATLVLDFDPAMDTLVDVNGFFGVSGRMLRIESMQVSLESTGAGSLQSGVLSYTVGLRADYDVLDDATGALLATDSLSTVFPESGTFVASTNEGFLDGSSVIEDNQDTLIGLWDSVKKGWAELQSGTTLISLDENDLASGAPTTIAYLGGSPSGFMEFELSAAPEFGGGTLRGTMTGTLTIQASKSVPAATSTGLFLGLVILGSVGAFVLARRGASPPAQ